MFIQCVVRLEKFQKLTAIYLWDIGFLAKQVRNVLFTDRWIENWDAQTHDTIMPWGFWASSFGLWNSLVLVAKILLARREAWLCYNNSYFYVCGLWTKKNVKKHIPKRESILDRRIESPQCYPLHHRISKF